MPTSAKVTLPVSVKAVIFDERGHVLLGLNDRNEWELPGGRIEPGETPESAVVREVLEEAGVAVVVDCHLGDWAFEVLPGRHVLISAYSCRLLDGEPVVSSVEHSEVRFWSPEALRELRLPAVYRQAIAACR